MAEVDAARRMRLVAVGASLVALVFTAVAVGVVIVRDRTPARSSAKQEELAPVIDRDVHATDVARLGRDALEVVIDKGVTKGLRVKDRSLANALGLEDGDVITSISGRALTRELDSYSLVSRLSMLDATVLYVEVTRNDKAALLRWRLDGDLRQARHGTPSSGVAGVGSLGAYTPSFTPSDPDPVLDTIEKVADNQYRLPRTTLDALLADPIKYGKQARVVPSMRNGQPDGLKLYAIRPSSAYAKLGFSNGDTIRAINGFEIASVDKALELYAKLKDPEQLTFDVWRRGQPLILTLQITK